ncbi:MAG: glycerol-3-phosphate 1-O-acyltransferase PlsY [Endomicrobium sp.]|nr:glycerol-3-phosphate 1-O-acyltransferase PlsY [Endomicrobium sp.]
MFILIIYIILSYVVGSIPFAYIISKLFKDIDISITGSKNIGTTNVFRTVGKLAGILTFFADVFKGWLVIEIAKHYINSSFDYLIFIIFATLIGHIYSVFMRFKGGKGVATSLGIFMSLSYIPVLFSVIIFTFIVLISGYVSLGSIVASISLPILLIIFKYNLSYITVSFIVACIIIFKHKSNIKQLKNNLYRKNKTER